MKNNIQNALNSIVGNIATLKTPNGAGRAFELFIMTGIALSLKKKGFNVHIQRSDGSTITSSDLDRCFIQRGGKPAGVAPSSAGTGNPSTIRFGQANGVEWEIWNGVVYSGRSSAGHEIDISVVPASVGAAMRKRGGSPIGRPRISIECKDVGTAGGLDEMRSFIARLYDLTLLSLHHVHPPLNSLSPFNVLYPDNSISPKYSPAPTYWVENRRTKNIIARRAGFTKGTSPLATYHHVEPYDCITVGSSSFNALVDDVAEWIKKKLK